MMNLNEINAQLEKNDQQHLLAYYDQLDEKAKDSLLEQIAHTDLSIVNQIKNKQNLNQKGKFSPLEAMELDEIEQNKAEFEKIGLDAIRQGKVAAVLLAGGMGTRLGSDNPKGMYDIGITAPKYIFQCLINNLMDVTNVAQTKIHLFVMTSDKNHDKTLSFFNEKNFFGYDSNFVHFFKQEMAPASDYNGKIYLEEKGKLATSPNGNGGWFSSLAKAGLLELAHKEGIEWLNVFAVDNVLQRIADPVFVGATIQKNCTVGAKVVKKAAPDEKVGVICLENGHPSIVEYYELTEEMMNAKDKNGNPAYNFGVILNYLFNVA
ncbi:MAG: UTP--glucose-1-phosphate uridylyltransferase, partial [Spirochaetales bacterium]|nr:UTP--glucose-1-phosphate uridylyltransferase [Spirochaetales bacterium]